MIFRRSQKSRALPPHSIIDSVVQIRDDRSPGSLDPVSVIPFAHLVELREKKPRETGDTLFYVSISRDNYLHVFPTPNRSVEFRVRYAPPLEEC